VGLVERIKILCDEKKTSFAEVERNTGISNGQIRRWNTSSPKLENVKKVAEYFNVSLDYLTGFNEELLGEIGESEKQRDLDYFTEKFDEFGFELGYEDNNGIEIINITHHVHGTVKTVELNEFIEHGESILEKLKVKYLTEEIQTIAAHHDGEEWTEEELEEIERFKEFVKSRRKHQG